MNKILVIGGDTQVGGSLVELLRRQHPLESVVALDADTDPDADDWSTAFAGVDRVVDIADAVTPHAPAILEGVESATRGVITAAEAAGARHIVLVSSMGLGRAAESDHFAARLRAETLVEGSPVPHSIVRTTQLFESVRKVVRTGLHGHPDRGRFIIQPIAAADVARAVAAIVDAPPTGSVVALAGPDRFRLDQLVESSRRARFHHHEAWISAPTVAMGSHSDGAPALLRHGTATVTSTRFQDWVASVS